jgi:hypothetical protein
MSLWGKGVSKPRILVITTCTGEKTEKDNQALTLVDFRRGRDHVLAREKGLSQKLRAAETLYSGMQHIRLMRGVQTARDAGLDLDLRIVSAGYGLVHGSQKLAPYEATFIGMGKAELRDWARQLGIPRDVRKTLAEPHDVALVLMGNDYLTACELDEHIELGAPTLVLCGKGSLAKLPELKALKPVTLSSTDTKRFACGLVGLKGEVAARLLEVLAANPDSLIRFVDEPQVGLDELTDAGRKAQCPVSSVPHLNRVVDRVIDVPDAWWQKPHRGKLRYFIPEWDDLVDPEFDFVNEAHSGGAADWSNEVYAHQLYPEPNYDGILVSREVVKKGKKKARVDQLGIHRFLRVPRSFPVMGDCGAFGYINQDVPPYTTEDVIDYYTRHDFDYGVSVDHLILAGTESKKKERYELTIHNAEDFLKEHQKRGLKWTPIGAVQGWDPESYADATKQYVAMGYRYIGLGGLVRTNTKEIIETLEAVQRAIPEGVNVHLFGIARLAGIRDFVKYGATSIDNASMLRKAWLGSELNYFTAEGWYSAIRIPEAKDAEAKGGSFRAKSLVRSGSITFAELKRLEQACLKELRTYAESRGPVPEGLLDHLVTYDELVAGQRKLTRERLYRTLSDRPWEKCDCAICQRWGVEVLVFRGNNRNRRRGFHNTYVFYRQLQQVLRGHAVSLPGEGIEDTQMSPFMPTEAAA